MFQVEGRERCTGCIIWATQKAIAELFDVKVSTINEQS